MHTLSTQPYEPALQAALRPIHENAPCATRLTDGLTLLANLQKRLSGAFKRIPSLPLPTRAPAIHNFPLYISLRDFMPCSPSASANGREGRTTNACIQRSEGQDLTLSTHPGEIHQPSAEKRVRDQRGREKNPSQCKFVSLPLCRVLRDWSLSGVLRGWPLRCLLVGHLLVSRSVCRSVSVCNGCTPAPQNALSGAEQVTRTALVAWRFHSMPACLSSLPFLPALPECEVSHV